MQIVDTIEEFRRLRRLWEGRTVGFVPTMGALHRGHASLIARSVAECDVTVLSIYVNATQFDNADDLSRYPRTLERDAEMAGSLGAHVTFVPDYQQMYPDDFTYRVEEIAFSRELCGAHRDGHFTGVLTVVMKLLNIVQPDRAYFGEKDFQQLQLIRGMADAFFIDVEIVGCPIVREADGLALSSRNQNLTPVARKLAPRIRELAVLDKPDDEVRLELDTAGFHVDYVETRLGRRFVAARIGDGAEEVRLIDNVPVQGENE